MRLVFLDTGTLGMVANSRGSPRAVRCQQWARDLLAAGVRVFVPEICDDEERRKLIHPGSTSGLARLDRLKIGFDYAPITTDVMLEAAVFVPRSSGEEPGLEDSELQRPGAGSQPTAGLDLATGGWCDIIPRHRTAA